MCKTNQPKNHGFNLLSKDGFKLGPGVSERKCLEERRKPFCMIWRQEADLEVKVVKVLFGSNQDGQD